MSHDPFRAPTGGPHRVYVAPPPAATNEVPGHEDEVIRWVTADVDPTERARRLDLADEVEVTRAGAVRPAVAEAIARQRAALAGRPDPTAGLVQPPEAAAPEDRPPAAEQPSVDDVPSNAVAVAEWVRAGRDAVERRARAEVAYEVESGRPVQRSTVLDAVDAAGVLTQPRPAAR